MQSNDPHKFWKYIGQLGITQKRKEKIHCEVINVYYSNNMIPIYGK